MDDFVRAMHTRSGLLAAIEASTLSLGRRRRPDPEPSCKRHIPEARTVPLAGNSIGTDRRFLATQLPEIEDYLHYRSVDVSTIKELCRRWLPDVYKAAPEKKGGHRALQDIRESVAELAYYRGAVFDRAGADPPVPAAGQHPADDRRGEHVTPSNDAPRCPWPRPTRTLTAPGQLVRDGGAATSAACPPGRGRTRRRRCAPSSTCRSATATPRSSSTRTSARPSPSTTASPAPWPTACATTFGVEQGDRVAIIMRNLPEWVMAFWAATLAGAIVVPLNAWWSGEELRYGLEDSGSKVAFVDTRAGRADPARSSAGCATSRAVIVADEHRTAPAAPLTVSEPTDGSAPVPEWPFAARAGRRGRGRLAARHHHRPGGRRHHLLHLGHHRAAQGRGRHPPQHVHQPDEPLLHQHPRRHCGSAAAARRRRARGRRRPSSSRCRSSTPPAATRSWSPTWPRAGRS